MASRARDEHYITAIGPVDTVRGTGVACRCGALIVAGMDATVIELWDEHYADYLEDD
jgi:hypothetical protein